MMILQKWLYGTLAVWAIVSCVFAPAVKAETANERGLSFNLAPRHGIGLNTTDITYADLDGDDFLDIAVVNGGQGNPSPTISIRFGIAGGHFGPPLVLPSYAIGEAIAAGDLNNDGKPEIVIASWYHNRVVVFMNQGNRQFAAPYFSTPPEPPYGGNPVTAVGEFFDLAIADFDGDGTNDVVGLQDQQGQRLRFFRFSGNGALTVFATLGQIPTPDQSYGGAIAVGDVNGDNRPDVVFADNDPAGNWAIWYVFGQGPGGTLSRTFGFPTVSGVVDVSIADLDNDSDNELVMIGAGIRLFRNNGNASFTELPRIVVEYPFPPEDLAINDLNNDGNLDLGILHGSVYQKGVMVGVRYGSGNGEFVEDKYYAVSSSSSIFSTDLDHDGKVDILTASSVGDQTDYIYDANTVTVLFNDNFQRFKAPLVTLWGPNYIDAGDFNGDGYNDLVSSWATNVGTTSGVDILINDTAGGLLPEVHHPSPRALNGMKTGDFNGDGKWDAVSLHEDDTRVLASYMGNGSGSVAQPTITPFARGLVNAVVGDFNSDGKDDVFVVDDSGQGYAMLSVGNGMFSVAPGSPIPSAVTVQTGDFNRDQHLDLVLGNVLWMGDGAGRFTQSPVSIPGMGNPTPGDFNGDGKLDLAGTTGEGLIGVLGNGAGGFGPSFYRPIEGTYSIGLTRSIVADDFDLDGRDEIAMIMESNPLGNLIVIQYGGANETPSWQQPVFYGAGPATRALVATDFNNDGRPDLGFLGANARGIIYNTVKVPEAIFDFDGDRKTDISIFRPGPGQWWNSRSSDGGTRAVTFGLSTDKIVPADYTGDGKTDFAFFRPSTGQWFVLRSEDSSFFAFPFGNSTDLPVPADYDGDGKADAAVFRESSLTWFINKSSGGTDIIGFGAAGDKPVNADYDGDGKADIAIFRPNGANGAEWWIRRSSNASVFALQFGNSTDKAVPGDYTGDGKVDVAIWRPSTGNWFVLRSEDFSFFSFPFGTNGDVPVPGDYDGDGKNDAAVFRPSSSTWFAQRSTAGTLIQQFGIAGDIPLPSAYVR